MCERRFLKSLDTDENFKTEHTLFCRELRFVAIYALFVDLWAKKVPFWFKNSVFLGKTCTITWYIMHNTESNWQICDYAQKRRICRENCKYVFYGRSPSDYPSCLPKKTKSLNQDRNLGFLKTGSISCSSRQRGEEVKHPLLDWGRGEGEELVLRLGKNVNISTIRISASK